MQKQLKRQKPHEFKQGILLLIRFASHLYAYINANMHTYIPIYMFYMYISGCTFIYARAVQICSKVAKSSCRTHLCIICKRLDLYMKYQFCITKLKRCASISLNYTRELLKKKQKRSIKSTYFKITSN